MRLTTTRLFPLALMLSLALLTFYLDRMVREGETAPAAAPPRPGLHHHQLQEHDLRPRGQAAQRALREAHGALSRTTTRTELFAPHVLQTKPSQPRITVSAERGAVSADGEEIFLYDNVVLVREAEAEQPEARLTTSFLHIVRDRSLVRTDREVTIVEDNRSLSGRGMEYNSESRVFTLLADVRGRFEPKK